MKNKIKIIKTSLDGPYLIRSPIFKDLRGEFMRLFCNKEFNFLKLKKIVQINFSKNLKKSTIRGLHYQTGKFAEDKIIFCTSGKLQDFFVNIKKNSNQYLKSSSVVLDDEKNNMVFVPRGFAHGFLTLENNTNLIYFSTNFYNPKFEKSIKWDDPLIRLKLKIKPKFISKKDNSISWIRS